MHSFRTILRSIYERSRASLSTELADKVAMRRVMRVTRAGGLPEVSLSKIADENQRNADTKYS
jgi:hypothetical protein